MCYDVMLVETELGRLVENYSYKDIRVVHVNKKLTEGISTYNYYHVSGFEHPRLPILTSNGFQFMEWGLIPRFEKEYKHNPEANRLNAKNETFSSLISYREAFQKRKFGILPVNAFFESRDYKGFKVPYLVYDRWDEYLNLAVIYDSWFDIDTGKERNSFAILTTEADGIMKEIHNSKHRMPVIFPYPFIDHWLNPTINDNAAQRLAGYQYLGLEAHTVSKLVNQTRNFRNTKEVAMCYNYTERDFNLEYTSKQARKREARK